MVEAALPPLSEWESFYVIIGSSAAALTGLMFVVVALRSERRIENPAEATRAFGTPTILHFCSVLLVAAILSTPRHTVTSLGLCLGTVGLAGLALGGCVVVQVRSQSSYAMVAADWLWHVSLPPVAYAAILGAALALARRPEAALYAVGAAALLLLFIGIHNAWDAAVWISAEREK